MSYTDTEIFKSNLIVDGVVVDATPVWVSRQNSELSVRCTHPATISMFLVIYVVYNLYD